MSGLLKLLGQKRENDTKPQIENKNKKEAKTTPSKPILNSTINDTKSIIDQNGNSSNNIDIAIKRKLNPTLPIYKHTEEINALIKSNQVIIISGNTGCGKTTQVPQIIYYDGELNHKPVKILITQPRRIAAVSIAKRLSSELKTVIGDLVGYHVGMNPYFNSEKTKIIIKTTGIFLEELIHEKSNMNHYTHLIIDEVHERDINIDFALLLVKHFLSMNSAIKLILMSATIATELFSNYFSKQSICTINEDCDAYDAKVEVGLSSNRENDNDNSHLINFEWNVCLDDGNDNANANKAKVELIDDSAPILEIKDRVFKNYTFHLDQIIRQIKLTKAKGKLSHLQLKEFSFNFSKKNPKIDDDLFLICLNLIECINCKEVNPNDKITNSVLIFLPGYGEIIAIMTYLKEYFSARQEIEILMLHSNISDEEQEKVFMKTNKRKIILATNIAESSITIDGTCYVIDFCLVKELQFKLTTHHESLELKWASKANCYQRAGRVGRTCEGYVFRLVTEEFFNNCLDDFPSPEILRVPLEKLILKVKVYDCGEPKVILGRAIQPPDLLNINTAILNLKNCGALTAEDPTSLSGRLTELGKVYAELPIDIKYSRLIMMSCIFGLADPGIVSAAILSQEKRLFKMHKKSRRDLFEVMTYFSKGTECDVITNYNAFKEWDNEFGFKLQRSEYDRKLNKQCSFKERSWCIDHCLDAKLLREVLLLSADIKKRLSQLNVYEGKSSQSLDMKLNSEATVNLFKYIIAGAFYGKVIKSRYHDIESIQSRAKSSTINDFDSLRTILISGIPLNTDMEIIKNIFASFGTINSIDYTFQQMRISFDTNDYAQLIKTILFTGSNAVFGNKEFEIPTNQGGNLDKQSKPTFLRKPEYKYELVHYDLFRGTNVEMHKDSINHISIESNESLLPLITHVCDEYTDKETKLTTQYVTKMPCKPMLDLILTLIFAPYAKFYPNQANNQYKSFKVIGNDNEFVLTYLFSSIDVKEINAIRRILNKLVKTKEASLNDFGLLRNQLITKINDIVNKQRIKIIARDNWNRLFFKFYPDLKGVQDSKFAFFQNDENELKLNINQHESGKSKELNDFLEPLTPLKIKEDYRLWTPQGLTELEMERKKFNAMREELIGKLSKRRRMVNHIEPEVYCAGCNSFICSISNLAEDVNNLIQGKLFRLHLWGIINDLSLDDKSIEINSFVLEWQNNFKRKPDSYLKCFEGNHIIGVRMNNDYYITSFSDLRIHLPGEVCLPWTEQVWGNNFEGIKKELDKSKQLRDEYIKHHLECELCNYHCAIGNDYLEHLRSKEHIRLFNELQEEENSINENEASLKNAFVLYLNSGVPIISEAPDKRKENPVFSHREKASKKKDKMMINLYSRYMSQRDLSLSSTSTSTHHKKMNAGNHSKDKLKNKFESVIIEQTSKAKLSTSINEVDQYYLDIINQKNLEIALLKEEVEEMKAKAFGKNNSNNNNNNINSTRTRTMNNNTNNSNSNKAFSQNKNKKKEISFESQKRKIDNESKSNRNSMWELVSCSSKSLSNTNTNNTNSNTDNCNNKIIKDSCYIFKPSNNSNSTSKINRPISKCNLKQSLLNLKKRTFNVMSQLSGSNNR